MNLNLGWRDFGEFSAIVAAVAFLLWLWLRTRIASEFVTKDEFEERKNATDERLAKQAASIREIATSVAGMPTQANMRELSERVGEVERVVSERVGGVERAVAVVGETARGIENSVAKLDRSLTLFLENELKKGK